MNRKRREDEDYEDYKADLKAANEALKQRKMGNYFHVSKAFTAEGMPLQGNTYRKPNEKTKS